MNRSFIDIETGPESDEVVLAMTKPFKAFVPLPEFDPAAVKLGNRTEPSAVEKHLAAAKTKHEEAVKNEVLEYDAAKAEYYANAIADAALSALTGHVVAIGIRRNGVNRFLIAESPAQEKAILIEFLAIVREHIASGDEIVGFNTGSGSFAGFDLLFLAQRCMKHGLSIAPLRNGRFWNSIFVDLLEVWRMGDRTKYITLDALAKFFGFAGKNGNGAHFADLYAADPQTALGYLGNDLLQTELVGGRMGYGPPAIEADESDPFRAAA